MGKKSSPKSSETKRYIHSDEHLWADTDLRHVATSPITDQYWRGAMGKAPIILDMQSGYVGATHVCEHYGSDFGDWKKTTSAKEIIAYLALDAELDPDDLVVEIADVHPEVDGEYVHHDLISIIISWASPSFGATMFQIVTKHIVQEASDMKEDAAIRKQNRRK